MSSEEDEVRNGVHFCFDTLGNHIGADISDKPRVSVYRPNTVPPIDSSGCDFQGNITIVERDIGNPRAYFSEVGHSMRIRLNPGLRNFLRKKGITKRYDSEVEEFFDRLSENMGIELLGCMSVPPLVSYDPNEKITLEKLKESLETFRDKEAFRGNLFLYLNFDRARESILKHTIGYVSADIFCDKPEFMEEAKKLFSMPRSRIKKNYIDTEEVKYYRNLLDAYV